MKRARRLLSMQQPSISSAIRRPRCSARRCLEFRVAAAGEWPAGAWSLLGGREQTGSLVFDGAQIEDLVLTLEYEIGRPPWLPDQGTRSRSLDATLTTISGRSAVAGTIRYSSPSRSRPSMVKGA